jgi:hypothetical protein
MPSLNLDDLGARALGPADDPFAFWRATFLGGTMTSSTSFYFDEEPEVRAIEAILAETGASSVRVVPPTAEPVESAYEAAERLLAIARGLPQDKANDPEGLADLVTAAIAYSGAVRQEATS